MLIIIVDQAKHFVDRISRHPCCEKIVVLDGAFTVTAAASAQGVSIPILGKLFYDEKWLKTAFSP